MTVASGRRRAWTARTSSPMPTDAPGSPRTARRGPMADRLRDPGPLQRGQRARGAGRPARARRRRSTAPPQRSPAAQVPGRMERIVGRAGLSGRRRLRPQTGRGRRRAAGAAATDPRPVDRRARAAVATATGTNVRSWAGWRPSRPTSLIVTDDNPRSEDPGRDPPGRPRRCAVRWPTADRAEVIEIGDRARGHRRCRRRRPARATPCWSRERAMRPARTSAASSTRSTTAPCCVSLAGRSASGLR